MKLFEITLYKMFLFMVFSYAVPSDAQIEVTDPVVQDHDVSKWNDDNESIELSQAVVDGLASTQLKMHIPVPPETKVVHFSFYRYVTRFLKKYVQGLTTVRIASIVLHYKPHTDSCSGTVSYALVDERQEDEMDVKSTTTKNGITTVDKDFKGKDKSKTIHGKTHQLVTVKCDRESLIQMSMNYFVTIDDLKLIKLVQIVSGVSMKRGKLATLSLGWKTVPGEATVYLPYHAQRYYIPRMKMPELIGKDKDFVYNSIVKMAKDRHNKEVQMLNNLQRLIDGQMVINNDLDTDLRTNIEAIEHDIKKQQSEIEQLDRVIPEKQKLVEAKKQLQILEKIRADKMKEYLGNDDLIMNKPSKEEEKINQRDVVDDDFITVKLNDHSEDGSVYNG